MKENHIQIISITLTLFYGTFVAWLYWAAPRNLEDVSLKARETIETATSKTQVLTNTYEIDGEKFDEAKQAFRSDNFVLAIDLFERADKEQRDAKTQFYIAYSYYRQGWGRFANDDELFKKGLEKAIRAIRLDDNFRSEDGNLKLRTPVELKFELEEGLRVTVYDFNPFKIARERK